MSSGALSFLNFLSVNELFGHGLPLLRLDDPGIAGKPIVLDLADGTKRTAIEDRHPFEAGVVRSKPGGDFLPRTRTPDHHMAHH
jgi:hypothetical protein